MPIWMPCRTYCGPAWARRHRTDNLDGRRTTDDGRRRTEDGLTNLSFPHALSGNPDGCPITTFGQDASDFLGNNLLVHNRGQMTESKQTSPAYADFQNQV